VKAYEEVVGRDRGFWEEVNTLAKKGWKVVGYQVVNVGIASHGPMSFVLMEREIPEPEKRATFDPDAGSRRRAKQRTD